ncbi:Nif3-like dinuclear metal center hexameric protein [Salidesulfovibrio brasiliensis]|uniref:Nif3-like dinuclear metal center hexameric protein n=1 Tax=Salidesulfovibrio brasiliensis TaxID=221711 RepID=UPI0006D134C0|nr:Nif3-like dinuclear metal center hexameric protein [Salidesulfovibrio brasiliensis]
MEIQAVLNEVRRLAPEGLQAGWDNSGVQVPGVDGTVSKVAVALEPTPAMVRQCLDWGAGLVVTHHPLYMKPKAPLGGAYLDVLRACIKADTWLYAAHTSLDCAPGGPAFWLGDDLGLSDRKLLEPNVSSTPVEVSFYAEKPLGREDGERWADRESVHSVSQLGTGEVRVIVEKDVWPSIAEAIAFGQGERPEFYVRELAAPKADTGFGEIGSLPEAVPFAAFMERLHELTGRKVMSVCGPKPESVSTVAYCGGSGSGLAARAAGADVFVTGDMKYHPAVDAAAELGLCIVDAGHFSIEEEMMRRFAVSLGEALSGVTVRFFEGADPFEWSVAP